MRYPLLLMLGTLICSSAVMAQQQQMPPQPEPLSPDEVTDEHLNQVYNVMQSAQVIQKKADEEMKAVVEKEDMEFSRFQQILMAQQNPQMAGQVNITEDEQKTIQKMQPELQKIGMQAQQEYQTAIEDEGFTTQKFQQVAQAIQTHAEVAERFEEIRKEKSESDN